MLTDEQLSEIEERHQARKEFRADLPPGQWLYDSFAFIENCHEPPGGARVRRSDRVCILIRRRPWMDGLMKICGDDILDQGTFVRGDDKDLQPGDVGQYIEKMMDGSAENDVDALLEEVSELRSRCASK